MNKRPSFIAIWLRGLAVLLIVPVIAAALWGLAWWFQRVIPGCDLGMVGVESDACMLLGVDIGIALVILAFPAFLGAFALVPYAGIVVAWLAIGAVGTILGMWR